MRPFAIPVLLALLCLGSLAQEPDAPPAKAAPARRNNSESTREFLGLGPAPDRAAAQKGEALYKENCSTCHGENARGAQGPNLVRSVLVLHDENDRDIEALLKNGRAQGGMPAFPQLTHDQVHAISQYLKLQVELTANRGTYGQTYSTLKNKPSGDPQKGQAFFAANCTGCHSVTGDLARLATKYSDASVMQSRFLWPASKEPPRVSVTTASGQTVTGSLLRMDDFDVSLREANGEVHYWPASQVKVQLPDTLQGHRALLPRYADADIHNVTAYLETLK